jgi:hypothetical protein
MTIIDFSTKLANTLSDLKALGNAVSNLINVSPDILENPEINSRLNEFKQAHQEAEQRLKKPTFSIATIGTTSSGKSTIVNALIGRRIAPIEVGEMSGGVLTIKHLEQQKLFVDNTEGAVWKTGYRTEIEDKDCYQEICDLMHLYHQHRQTKDCIAPKVEVFAPLLPVCNPSLLNLPNGVDVEFIDLPGVKSVLDRTNLEIIQKQVHKAFSLVALDYTQVDDLQRKRLLEELQKVVKYLAGRTDSMIFVLNKVNLQTSDNLPLSKRITKLQQEIQEVLSLQKPPDILPINALLLYYAQCAWGVGTLNEASKVSQTTRLELLKAMFKDCGGTIANCTEGNWDLDDWFRDVRRKVNKGEEIDDETMKQILQCAFEWSGGEELWQVLCSRVKESFSELVLLPILIEVFQNYDALEKSLDVVLQTRKIYSLEGIQSEREKIAQIRQSLENNTKKIHQDFEDEIKQYMEALKTDDRDLRSQVIQEAAEKGRKGFQVIFDAVSDVEAELTQVLIAPVRDALKEDKGAFDLEEKLTEVVSPPLAHDVARAYDNASRRLKSFSKKSNFLVKRVRKDDQNAMTELKNDERYVRLLYVTMREAISSRAEFSLQAKAKEFIAALDQLINEQLTRLRYSLLENELSNLNLEQAVITYLRKKLSQNLPELPENFFEIPTDNITRIEDTKYGKISEERVRKEREVGSCFDDRDKIYYENKAVMGNVEYQELRLPDTENMAQQWLKGVKKGEENLWIVLSDWILNRSNEVITMFEESLKEIVNLAERALEEQLHLLEQQENELERWQKFEEDKKSLTVLRQRIEEEVSQSNIS